MKTNKVRTGWYVVSNGDVYFHIVYKKKARGWNVYTSDTVKGYHPSQMMYCHERSLKDAKELVNSSKLYHGIST